MPESTHGKKPMPDSMVPKRSFGCRSRMPEAQKCVNGSIAGVSACVT